MNNNSELMPFDELTPRCTQRRLDLGDENLQEIISNSDN